jgi:hypothetical protein
MANRANDSLLPALTYQAGDHPLSVQLPAAPDDGFLDSKIYTAQTTPPSVERFGIYHGNARHCVSSPSTPTIPRVSTHTFIVVSNAGELFDISSVYARLLRIAQGMDPQKRKISGGHVEYEQNRWLEAFGLSLNFAGTRDALSESLTEQFQCTASTFRGKKVHILTIFARRWANSLPPC